MNVGGGSHHQVFGRILSGVCACFNCWHTNTGLPVTDDGFKVFSTALGSSSTMKTVKLSCKHEYEYLWYLVWKIPCVDVCMRVYVLIGVVMSVLNIDDKWMLVRIHTIRCLGVRWVGHILTSIDDTQIQIFIRSQTLDSKPLVLPWAPARRSPLWTSVVSMSVWFVDTCVVVHKGMCWSASCCLCWIWRRMSVVVGHRSIISSCWLHTSTTHRPSPGHGLWIESLWCWLGLQLSHHHSEA